MKLSNVMRSAEKINLLTVCPPIWAKPTVPGYLCGQVGLSKPYNIAQQHAVELVHDSNIWCLMVSQGLGCHKIFQFLQLAMAITIIYWLCGFVKVDTLFGGNVMEVGIFYVGFGSTFN